jgi:putative membrane protein
MNRTLRQALLLTIFGVAACSSNPPPPAPVAEAPPAPKPTLSQADQTFVHAASASDAFEIQSSQLAGDKARRKPVKDFASQMVQAHTGTTQQLMQIVQSKGLPPMQPQLDDQQQQMLQMLQGESGGKFDRDYIHDQIKGHEMAVMVFKQEISDGQDADVKSFAQQTLPVIEQHLAEAKKLAGMHEARMSRHHGHAQASPDSGAAAPDASDNGDQH